LRDLIDSEREAGSYIGFYWPLLLARRNQ